MTLKDFLKGKAICVLGAHTDDIELGMGGSLNQLKDVGYYVKVFSTGYEGKGATSEEFYKSMEVFGVDCPDLDSYPTRNFHAPEWTQRIRDDVFNLKHYDVFFTHSKYSQHLDHRILGEAVDDIIKDKTIICWDEVHCGKNIPINMWNEISTSDLLAKQRAMDCYVSQKDRPYFEGDFIATQARYRGNQILKPYAEAFNVVRLVI
jgi:LmbE family N-acetylglucosaminyl deacetylase